ncbi:MAG: cysteine desulfurase [archaeon]|nr:cysteine desulfurase [archaeon]
MFIRTYYLHPLMVPEIVYFDNGATTAIAPEVLESMMPYLTTEYGNPSSVHFMGNTAAKGLRMAREQVANSLGSLPSEIVFTSGGTESDNLALIGSATACRKNDPKRNRIVTTCIEHEAVLETCEELKRRGFDVTVLSVDKEGYLDPSILDDAMSTDVCLVSIMAANNIIGTIQDIADLSKVSHEYGSYFHTDAVQGYTKMNINVERDKIDMLSLSGHKIHAPKGIGALYVRSNVPISPIIFGGGQEMGLRSSTENIPGIIGLGKAAEMSMESMDKDIQLMTKLRDEIIDDMLKMNGVHLNGPIGKKRLCNNAHFRFDKLKGTDVVLALSRARIAASSTSACSAGLSEPSYVLTSLGLSPKQCTSTLRVSLSRYNTEDDIVHLINAMKTILRDHS